MRRYLSGQGGDLSARTGNFGGEVLNAVGLKFNQVVTLKEVRHSAPDVFAKRRSPTIMFAKRAQVALEALSIETVIRSLDADTREVPLQQPILEVVFLLDISLVASRLHFVERRTRDVHVASFDQVAHVSEEEGENERPDVRAVDISVGHDNELVVPRLGYVKVCADTGAHRGNHRFDLVV